MVEIQKLLQHLNKQQQEDEYNDDSKNILHQLKTFQYSKNKAEEYIALLVKILTELTDCSFNYIEVLDSSYFNRLKIAQQFWPYEIDKVVEETAQYENSMIIFDLDSIADLQKNYTSMKKEIQSSASNTYQDDASDPTFSYTINKQDAFRKILERFVAIEPSKNQWLVAISKHHKLTRDFKEKLGWSKTQKQKNDEEEIVYKNESVICQRFYCQMEFQRKQNDTNECAEHISKRVYKERDLRTNEEKNKIMIDYWKNKINKAVENNQSTVEEFQQKIENCNKISPKATIMYFNAQEIYLNKAKLFEEEYKWECCNKSIFEKGCQVCKHIEKQN